MTNKCWCGEPLVTVLLKTPWRDAGVQPMLHCPVHGDLDSADSLRARAEAAEADAETAWGIIKCIAASLPEGARPFDLYATSERVAEVVAEVERLNGVAAKALAIAEAPNIQGAVEALKTALEPNR